MFHCIRISDISILAFDKLDNKTSIIVSEVRKTRRYRTQLLRNEEDSFNVINKKKKKKIKRLASKAAYRLYKKSNNIRK